jgi:hypothetical protein
MNAAKKLKPEPFAVPQDWEKVKVEDLIRQIKNSTCVAGVEVIWSHELEKMAEKWKQKKA